MNLNDVDVTAIQISDINKKIFAAFDKNKTLYLYNIGTDRMESSYTLDNIMTAEKDIALYFQHPYVCVAENFGLNAAVVNLENHSVSAFSREDYHANVSSYSVGFLVREKRILFVHQTMWNRLDITDLETGALLTDREVKYGGTNYLDYFHSAIHVSPDYQYIENTAINERYSFSKHHHLFYHYERENKKISIVSIGQCGI